METTRPRWSNQTKLLVIIFLIIGAGYFLYKFSIAIAPLVLAIILAYVLSPLVNILHSKLRFPRALAIVTIYLILGLIITGVLWLFIPMLIKQIGRFTLNIEGLLIQAGTFFSGQINIAGYTIDGQIILQRLVSSLEGAVSPVLGGTLDIVTTLLESIVWIVFIVVISVYLIKDNLKLRQWFSNLIPPLYKQDYKRIIDEINTIWSSFFRGQLLLALIVAAIITIEGLIIGMPFALVMGLIAGLMEFLPSVGHGIWLTLALIVGFFGGSTWIQIPPWAFAILIVILHIIFTQFDLNYLIPRIIGRSVHLPPLVVILGIVAGAALAGVLGVVLAAPTIASLRVILRYIYAQLFELEPFQEEPTVVPLPPPDPLWWQKGVVRKKRS
jgi:predicted PurR-regulated permease PerM